MLLLDIEPQLANHEVQGLKKVCIRAGRAALWPGEEIRKVP